MESEIATLVLTNHKPAIRTQSHKAKTHNPEIHKPQVLFPQSANPTHNPQIHKLQSFVLLQSRNRKLIKPNPTTPQFTNLQILGFVDCGFGNCKLGFYGLCGFRDYWLRKNK